MDRQTALTLLHDERRQAQTAIAALEAEGLDEYCHESGTTTFSMLMELRLHLGELDEAFIRLNRGAYGRCLSCGLTIDDERLRAVPATRFCVDHEAFWEGRRLVVPIPTGAFETSDNPLADDIAAWEALQHLDLIPDDEASDPIGLGPEEAAVHVVPDDADHPDVSARLVARLEGATPETGEGELESGLDEMIA